MRLNRELRVGVCACAQGFGGRLEGKVVVVDDRQLVIRQICIPQRYTPHRRALKTNRCHFFIDQHTLGKKKLTELHLVEILPWACSSASTLCIGGHGNLESSFKEWRREKTPPSAVLIAGMRRIAQTLPRHRRIQWLNSKPVA